MPTEAWTSALCPRESVSLSLNLPWIRFNSGAPCCELRIVLTSHGKIIPRRNIIRVKKRFALPVARYLKMRVKPQAPRPFDKRRIMNHLGHARSCGEFPSICYNGISKETRKGMVHSHAFSHSCKLLKTNDLRTGLRP
jgi:hypothetical protein